MKNKIIPYFPIVLLLFHVIGFYLFMRDPKGAELTAINLFLCGALVFLTEKKRSMALVFALIFFLGFLVELIGVKTGLLFGNYRYTDVLSKNLAGVPVIIGLNWFVIIVASASIFINLKVSKLIKALLAGLAATLMDAIIEPVAIKYQFWIWQNDVVPWYNFVCWYIFGSIFAGIYLQFADDRNRTAFFLYFIWIVFFTALNLI